MILPLIILYVVTLVYLAITERFRNFASLIGLQGWCCSPSPWCGCTPSTPPNWPSSASKPCFSRASSSRDCFSPSSAARRSTASRAPAPRSPARCLLSLVALAVSASVTYYIADTTIDLVFFGVAFYSLLSGLILIVMRRRIFSHMVGFLVIENGVFLFSTAIGVEMPAADQLRHPARHPHLGADAGHLLHQNRRQAPCRRRRFTHQRKGLTP